MRQRILVVSCDNYAYLVPFVEEEDYFFLKTVIPSRKARRGPPYGVVEHVFDENDYLGR